MASQKYGHPDKPGDIIVILVPDNVETPASIEVRYPDEDYRSYVFWWHYA
jgi:hypothetical protein